MRTDTTILVIDDERVILETISEIFRDEYNIIKAQSADDGLRIIRKVSLDLIITDCMMPGQLSGLTLAKTLHFENNHIPIIMISGSDISKAALGWGVKEFISKPFEIGQLRRAVQSCLQPKLRLLA